MTDNSSMPPARPKPQTSHTPIRQGDGGETGVQLWDVAIAIIIALAVLVFLFAIKLPQPTFAAQTPLPITFLGVTVTLEV